MSAKNGNIYYSECVPTIWVLSMYTIEDGKLAVTIARKVIEHHIKHEPIPDFEVPEIFKNKSGVFVTINSHPKHDLRGCIGFPEPHFPLIDAIIDSAKSASTRDPRFPPVSERELDKLVIEVSLLTPPELINVDDPKELPKVIKIGRDGLIAERGFYRGLLLPQVPVEWKWDEEEFLSHTCMKAGMMADCWLRKDVKFYRFSGEIFMEKTPRGEIVPKPLGD